jgi:hypothetical protein
MAIPPQPFHSARFLKGRLTMNLSSQRPHCMTRLQTVFNQCLPSSSWCLTLATIITLAIAGSLDASADDSEQFFESKIRPLLIEKCLECHNAEKQSGGLRLDSRDNILKGGDSGAAMIPGDPAASRLIQAIRYDGDLQMPPENPLGDDQKKLLTHWIELGAPWPADSKPMLAVKADLSKTHWAFQPVQHIEPPRIADNSELVRTPVDAFLLEKLKAAGLEMSPETDRRTLIRRATYALTGLPPSVQDVEQFVADENPDAYEKLIDRLLASPAHGEQWARHWLDVARYSDTKGYVYGREERFWVHAWNYRDWVVNALNSDMPYDRFLLLQIAADQVPDRSDNDLAAMGFLTIGRRFQGVRRDIIDDRIDVVCRGTMSLTVGCARCHDHKYDPIPTADYYSLYGVFDSSREELVALPPTAAVDETFVKEHAARLATMEQTRKERRATTEARIRSRIGDYLQAQLELGKYPEEGFDQILAVTDLLPSFVHRWRDYLRDTEKSGDSVFAAWHAYRRIPPEEFAQRAAAETDALKQLDASQLNPRVAAAFSSPPGTFAEVVQRYAAIFHQCETQWQAELNAAKTANQPLPERFTDAADEQLREVLYAPGRPCSVPDEPIVSTEYDFDSGTCNELWKLQVEMDRAILNAASQPRFAVTMRDRDFPVNPRVFKRGNPANKGEDVPRQFLKLLSGPDRKPFEQGSGRLELAQAIIDPTNPLTARVIVNRVWAHHFGTGLVATPGDFGVRAEPPSHPELLDWLTEKFIADGWSLKKLHRLIVTSAAFRQSSFGPTEPAQLSKAMTIDPSNRLLWRMNAHRLSFEEMRDSMLATSGELDARQGGKPTELFKPPYPVRRTIYGLVDRQFLPGTLRMFDFANPDLHIPQRSETTVPQQSLFLMNHPIVLERAKAMAKTVAHVSDPAEQIRQIYLRTLQRSPSPAQLEDALQLVREESPEAEKPVPTAADWSYGYGAIDEATQKITSFTPLPHFSGSAWQGGPAFPDGPLGWVQLSAVGGHPGNDRQHAVIRRWTAPRAMTISIKSELVHEPDPGDGVRAFIVSSRSGVLQSAKAHKQTVAMNVESIAVEPGDTLDFLVDIGDVLNSDQYFWRCQLADASATNPEAVTANAKSSASKWNSEADFPRNTVNLLTPLEQLAQVLMCSNEFMFVD